MDRVSSGEEAWKVLECFSLSLVKDMIAKVVNDAKLSGSFNSGMRIIT